MYVKVRCSTPTPRGVCNRWQFEIGAHTPDGVEFRYLCAHCKQITIALSSELTGVLHASGR